MKKNLIGAALDTISTPTVEKQTVREEATAVVSNEVIEALKAQYGAKWATAARRGNPYGREIPKGEGEYIRASFIIDAKQHKALSLLAKSEGLQIKEALELVLEVGLIATTGKESQEIALTPEDVAPKFTRTTK